MLVEHRGRARVDRLAIGARQLRANQRRNLDERVSQGEKFQLRGLPLEQTRARLMWVHKNNALAHAAALLDDLGTVAKIRTMSGPELGRQVKTDEVLAEIYRRAANEAATEYGTTEA